MASEMHSEYLIGSLARGVSWLLLDEDEDEDGAAGTLMVVGSETVSKHMGSPG